MPFEPLASAVLRQLHAIDQRLPAPRVRRLHLPAAAAADPRDAEYCGIELAEGAIGLSFVLLGGTLEQLLARHPGRAGAPLAGADALALAGAFGHGDAAERAVALAAINALTQSAWQRLGYQPPPASNSVGDMALEPGSHLGMIGCFMPLVEPLVQAGVKLSIVELDAPKVAALQARFPAVHATLERQALAGCAHIVGTSTMLLNDTLDAMLATCQAAREFAVIGPSAGLWPDALFARGVTRVCGSQIVDGEAFAQALRDGRPWGPVARKFAIDRATWPGWQALLDGAAGRP